MQNAELIRELKRGNYSAAADNYIAVIENRALSGGYGALGFVKGNRHRSVSIRSNQRRLLLRLETDFYICSYRIFKFIKRNKIQLIRNKYDALMAAVFADCDGIVFRTHGGNKHRFSEGAESLTLTDSIIDNTVVLTENVTVFINKVAFRRGDAE